MWGEDREKKILWYFVDEIFSVILFLYFYKFLGMLCRCVWIVVIFYRRQKKTTTHLSVWIGWYKWKTSVKTKKKQNKNRMTTKANFAVWLQDFFFRFSPKYKKIISKCRYFSWFFSSSANGSIEKSKQRTNQRTF